MSVTSKHLNIFIIILLFCTLSNCQKNRVIKSHGIIFLEKREVLIKETISNKNDVINILGEPHVKSINDINT